jgi:hypothetical protein
MSLYHKIQKLKDNPDTARSGSYWSPEEDAKLAESVMEDRPLAAIALDHKRSTGGIEIRLRTLAYNDYKNYNGLMTIEDAAKKYKISESELTVFVKDRERYMETKNKEREETDKKKEEDRALKEKKKAQERERKEAEKQKIREDKEAQAKLEEERKEADKQKAKEISKEENEKDHHYIYCLREREFIKTQENIYKVGKTSCHPFKRLKQYPEASELVLLLKVDDCHTSETTLLKYLDNIFEKASYGGKQIGREYYMAKEKDIIGSIFDCLVSGTKMASL